MEYGRESWGSAGFWFNDFPVVKILYTDYSHLAVLAFCEQTHFDNNCYEHQLQVKVMTRQQRPISDEEWRHVSALLRHTCLEPGDFTQMSIKG